MKSFSHGLKLAIPYGEIPFLDKPTSIIKNPMVDPHVLQKKWQQKLEVNLPFSHNTQIHYTDIHITHIYNYIYILYSVNLSSFYPSIFPGCSHNSLFKLLPFFSVPPVQPILHNAHHQLRPCGRRQELGGNFEGAGGGVLWLRAQRRCAGSPRLIHLG